FDTAVRGEVAARTENQQREGVEQLLHAALPDAKLVKYETSGALALLKPMTITMQIQVPNAAPTVGGYRLLRTLVTSGALGIVERFLPEVFGGLPSRRFGLDAQTTFEFDEDETVALPASTNIVALPNDAKSDNPASSLMASCKQTNPTTLDCHRAFAVKSRFIDPARYTELMASLASVSRIGRQPVVLGGGK
ncbi:MAG TPA: hypothetical protein VGO00_15085, partial [Kofleriaceae bacterium]|nr:hypothetical protein [Kofleriaceae bacterium]